MRRTTSLLVLCAALVVSAAVDMAPAEAKGSSSFKVGTYSGADGTQKISLTVKRARCGGKTQLCVTLSKGISSVSCEGSAGEGGAAFVPITAMVPLPSSGKVSEHHRSRKKSTRHRRTSRKPSRLASRPRSRRKAL